jgi:uncharacterized protein (DUF1015 family)
LVDVKPFKATRFSNKAGSIIDLVTQPYDKIDPLMQKKYYEKSIYNFCRIILPLETNKYDVAKNRLREWFSKEVLIKDEEPAFFISRQIFQIHGKRFTRIGLFVALRLYNYDEKIVFPHEGTYKEPKADRTNMLESVKKNLEPVFLIYSDPKKVTIKFFSRIIKTTPLIDFKDNSGVSHSIWKVADPKSISLVKEALRDKILVIADGHHRYESAISYRDTQRKKEIWNKNSAFNFYMSYIVPIEESGLVVLPTHRALKEFKLTSEIIKKLSEFFIIRAINPTVNSLESFLKKNFQKHAFCVYNGSESFGLILKNEAQAQKIINSTNSKELDLLDVTILRDLVFKHIMGIGKLKMHHDIIYAETTKEALEKVNNEEAKLAFLLNPVDPKIVWKIAQKGWQLPEKSTDFYPKPLSGLIMMDISNEEQL